MFSRKKKQPELQPRMRQSVNGISAKPTAFSYHANRSIRPEADLRGRAINLQQVEKKEQGTSKFKKYLFFTGVLLVLVALYLFLGVSTSSRVEVIQPNGFNYQPHSTAQYESAAAKAIGSSIYNRFKPTFSSSNIESKLKNDFPEVIHAAVTLPFLGSTPTVYLQLATPVLIYTNSAGNYLLGVNGVVIANYSQFNPKQLRGLPIVTSPTTGPLNDGQQVLTSSNVAFVRTIQTALTDKNIGINKMDLVPMAEELDVYPVGVSYYIKFNLHENDPLQQTGTYLATVATLKQQGKTPSQYVDVRVDGRAYYK